MKIAIDGPSGAGKSTVSKALAKRLGIIYVDTGALYRTIGLYVKSKGIDPDNADEVIEALPEINIDIIYKNGNQIVLLNGIDHKDTIRQPEISMYASKVSSIPQVREFLLNTQRQIAENNSVVMDGRDIGTVILPDAEVKIFMTASLENRALRRYKELLEKGLDVTFDNVLEDMKKRDRNDSNRKIAPAVAAKDAVILDNSGLNVEQSVDAAIKIIKNIMGEI